MKEVAQHLTPRQKRHRSPNTGNKGDDGRSPPDKQQLIAISPQWDTLAPATISAVPVSASSTAPHSPGIYVEIQSLDNNQLTTRLPTQYSVPTANRFSALTSSASFTQSPSLPIIPTPRQPIVSTACQASVPAPSQLIAPMLGQPVVPTAGQTFVPTPSQLIAPMLGQPVVPTAGQTFVPAPSQLIAPLLDQPIVPTAGQAFVSAPSQLIDPTPSQPFVPVPYQSIAPTPSELNAPTLSQVIAQTHSQLTSSPSQSFVPAPYQPTAPTPNELIAPTPSQPIAPAPDQLIAPTPGQPFVPTSSQASAPSNGQVDGPSTLTSIWDYDHRPSQGNTNECHVPPPLQSSFPTSSIPNPSESGEPPWVQKLLNQMGSINNKLDDIGMRVVKLESEVRSIYLLNEKVNQIEEGVTFLSKGFDACKTELKTTHSEVLKCAKTSALNTDAIAETNRRLTELESRTMRDNLILTGIPENTNESCEHQVKNLIRHQMGITENVEFDRVHRIGPPHQQGPGSKPRPIVAKFTRYKQRELVRSRGHTLKGTKFGVFEQYSKGVNEKRRILYPKMMAAREKNCYAKLQYDSLIINNERFKVNNSGQVYKDPTYNRPPPPRKNNT